MKNKILPVIIAVLLVAQISSMMKINDLQNQINNTAIELNNAANEISEIYANVDEMLKAQASLIEFASTEFGALDASALTAPVTFSITPKVVSEVTAVSLEIDGELFPMERSGRLFTVAVSCDVFGDATPFIVIDEGGVKTTTQDNRMKIESMKDALLPALYPHISGSTKFSGGTYTCEKTIYADIENTQSGNIFTQLRFVIAVEGEVVSQKEIPLDRLAEGWDVEEKIKLTSGQTSVMTLVATDSLGLEHHYMVDHFVAGASAQREPWFENEEIYSADGALLWQAGEG